jgi:MoaA/NifB/PqqE/SkfB family radical SAM enzyme
MASPDKVLETFRLIREVDPEILLCLSSNGLALSPYLRDLRRLNVTHLTLTVNAVDPQIGALIYDRVDFGGERYQGLAAASVLLANQTRALKMAADLGFAVKVNTVLIEGINQSHAVEVASFCASLGASLGNVMGHIPIKGTALGGKRPLSSAELRSTAERCEVYLPQVRHCRRCRADASGLLGEGDSELFEKHGEESAAVDPIVQNLAVGRGRQVRIAAVSRGGTLIDQHFGQAERFYVYLSDGQDLRLVETRDVSSFGGCVVCGKNDVVGRKAPKPKGFIERLANEVRDCEAVVAARVGDSPRNKLKELGVASFETYESIERAVLAAAGKLLADERIEPKPLKMATGGA